MIKGNKRIKKKPLNLNTIPLCVDLDGTLIKENILFSSLKNLLSKKPSSFPLALFWTLTGRAGLKRKVILRTTIYPEKFHYNIELLQFLNEEKSRGRPLFLITGADQIAASKIAAFLGVFNEWIGSDGVVNMTGRRKAAFLRKRFGQNEFDYVGNGRVDMPVWELARNALLVTDDRSHIKRVEKIAHVEKVFHHEFAKGDV